MTIRNYSSASTSMYGHKRPSLPPTEVRRPMKVAVDYGARVTSTLPRAGSVPPSSTVGYARQQTPGLQYQHPSRRLSSTASVSDLRSAALSTRSSMPGQLSRHSLNISTLPTSRSRSDLQLTGDEDLGSVYSTKSLSSFQRTNHPLRPSYHKGKIRARYSYLDDIEEEEKASRNDISDLRMRAAKAKECLDQHAQVLGRLRALQLNGPAPAVSVSVSPSTSSHHITSTASVRRESTPAYLSMSTTPMPTSSSRMTMSSARRKLRDLLSGGKTRRQSYA